MLLAGGLLASLALSGCVTHHHHHGASDAETRVQAPERDETRVVIVRDANRRDLYFHTEHRVNLVYDAGWGGYWVRELPHHYYYSGRYFRRHADRWHQSRHPRGPWVAVEARRLPRSLHDHHARIERIEAKQDWKQSKREAKQERRGQRQAHPEARRDDQDERREAGRQAREQHRAGQQARREKLRARTEERRGDQQVRREEQRAQMAARRADQRAHRDEVRAHEEEGRTHWQARKDEKRQARAGHKARKKRGGDDPVPASQGHDRADD